MSLEYLKCLILIYFYYKVFHAYILFTFINYYITGNIFINFTLSLIKRLNARVSVSDRSVIIYRLTSDQHDDYCKDFLSVGIGRYVPKAYGREAAEGEIKRRDITTLEKLQCYMLGKKD